MTLPILVEISMIALPRQFNIVFGIEHGELGCPLSLPLNPLPTPASHSTIYSSAWEQDKACKEGISCIYGKFDLTIQAIQATFHGFASILFPY
jgi:hypothetical protein